VRKAEELLGWSAQVALDDGLADTVSWLREIGAKTA
jgi:nucleoside-diphosphate-sugar epimerase